VLKSRYRNFIGIARVCTVAVLPALRVFATNITVKGIGSVPENGIGGTLSEEGRDPRHGEKLVQKEKGQALIES